MKIEKPPYERRGQAEAERKRENVRVLQPHQMDTQN